MLQYVSSSAAVGGSASCVKAAMRFVVDAYLKASILWPSSLTVLVSDECLVWGIEKLYASSLVKKRSRCSTCSSKVVM